MAVAKLRRLLLLQLARRGGRKVSEFSFCLKRLWSFHIGSSHAYVLPSSFVSLGFDIRGIQAIPRFGKNQLISELRPQFVVTTCEMKTKTMKNPKIRKSNDHLFCQRILLLVSVLLAWSGLGQLAPKAFGVVPPPDGDYPGRNTAEGHKALFSLTTGTDNAALGYSSLQTLTTGSLNTGIGAWTLALNTADYNTACGGAALLFNGTGTDNTAVGTAALLFNTIGEGNTATGAFALYSNTEGDFNTANGEFSLYFNSTGQRNTAIGDSALYQNTVGSRNTAVGNAALVSNTEGEDNTAVGQAALQSNGGNGNTAIGSGALSDNQASLNTAVGINALESNTVGNENTAVGAGALEVNTIGVENTGLGYQALENSTGDKNTAVGFHALVFTTGNFNTAIGREALSADQTGSSNIGVGDQAGSVVTTASHVICIGAPGGNVNNSCFIGNIWEQPGGSQAVYVNGSGKLGAQVSSRRFKDEIKPMQQSSEVIYGLKPVSFRYKPEIEPTRPLCFGLIAEEVEKVSPDLIVRGSDGQVNSVRYDAVNAMLLNEFLKEHQTVQELKKQVAKLTAGLQKVSAQLELTKSTPQTALNNR
jgi:trimeric autotransporter adhesin